MVNSWGNCDNAGGEELRHLRTNFYLETAFNFIWASSPILCVLSLSSDPFNFFQKSQMETDRGVFFIASFYTYTVVMEQELTPATAFASLAVWNELRFVIFFS